MRMIIGLLDTILNFFNILLLIYVILSWVRPAANSGRSWSAGLWSPC